MKILKYVLGFIAILVIAFFAMGIFIPEINYSTEVEVNKPLKEAWAVFQDDSKTADWVEGMKSIELIEGTEGEVGAKYKLVIEQDEEVMEMTETITALKAEKMLGLAFDSDVMNSDVAMHFTAKDENTTLIKADSDVRGKGIFWKSLLALSKSSMASHDAKMYGNLKTLIEENTHDYFPAPPPIEAEAASMESSASGTIQ